jgi:DNA-directed RNA polymerase subunit E'/Rpb7|tara:strand:+ start:3576 stop:4127 length:552 start_codon:yes stop_codon:yes gene_type:complete
MSKTYKDKLKKKSNSIYAKNMLTRKIVLPFTSVGGNLSEILKQQLEEDLYGKCCKDGYIKTDSIQICSYSSGIVQENDVIFDVLFECFICHPVEGQHIKCKVENITRAGIRATYFKEKRSPITIFIARDHHYDSKYFSTIKEEDLILIKVIGIRYELNDETISVLGELKPQKQNRVTKIKLEQ